MKELDQDELINRWTLIGKEPGLVAYQAEDRAADRWPGGPDRALGVELR
jgi:hypothetical protein